MGLSYMHSSYQKHLCSCIDCGKVMVPFTHKRPPKRCKVCRVKFDRERYKANKQLKKSARVCVCVQTPIPAVNHNDLSMLPCFRFAYYLGLNQ